MAHHQGQHRPDPFTDLLKANSYRMPINEPTVLDAWWNSYKAAIDVGIAKE